VARFGEEAVSDPDRVETSSFYSLREIEQISQAVARCEQRLAIVEIDAELDLRLAQGVTLELSTKHESSHYSRS